ncbi:uncharacterized protein N0V89_010946 [Didymosphaeria variabile]|uniref:Uncharacterized protein n=1 Tax=Didymosphaeria variabile TaxID=1932322 RepID=A0A9W8XDW6_9PLEO|nr:uncharacterized protein N0V89_010946 [Didymosphaeria variabile]KAJ4347012.1 hypothetical protein N0V89_010946 [Didymosphaeria variabile]
MLSTHELILKLKSPLPHADWSPLSPYRYHRCAFEDPTQFAPSYLNYDTTSMDKMDGMEDDDVAAAMGFSSFGGTKKRKYDQTNSPKAKADASGANTTRLGVRSEAKADNSQGAVIHASSNPATESLQASVRPQYKQNPKQPAASGLAAFLSRGQDLPERPAATGEDRAAGPPPQDSSNASWMVSFGGPAITQAELIALRNGVPDENGDKAYFLPSFVEDPWETPLRSK